MSQLDCPTIFIKNEQYTKDYNLTQDVIYCDVSMPKIAKGHNSVKFYGFYPKVDQII